MKKIILELTRKQALRLDVLWCKCGHRPNNHFDFDKKKCALPGCECKCYKEVIRLPK